MATRIAHKAWLACCQGVNLFQSWTRTCLKGSFPTKMIPAGRGIIKGHKDDFSYNTILSITVLLYTHTHTHTHTGTWWLWSMGSQRVRYNWATHTHTHTYIHVCVCVCIKKKRRHPGTQLPPMHIYTPGTYFSKYHYFRIQCEVSMSSPLQLC